MESFSPKIEEKILEYWKREQIFEKLRKKNQGKKRWSFLDGPITANNPMGVHHAWGRTYKDLFQRYKAMRGFDQRFQNGFDCQGLWVEVEVEKELGFGSKKDIEKYGIAEFVEKCKERVRKYSEIQTKQSIRLGQWMDWKNSYYTMSNENNLAIWHFLKKCWEKKLLYKGLDVVPWCWRCGTAISQHEILTEDYKEVAHDSVYVEYPVVGNRASNKKSTYLLVWTTTPWTLPGNMAVAIDPEKIYAEAVGEVKGNTYYLIKTAAEKLNLKITRTFKGKELVGLTYKSPFDNLPAVKKSLIGYIHEVVATDSRILPVSEEEGTGLIHIAPGQGVEDYRLSKKLKIPAIDLIDEAAVYLKDLGQFSGRNAKEHPEIIINYLEAQGFLFDAPKYTHRYPICWRCKTELVWRIADEWYISMDKLRKPLIEAAKKIKWIPSFGLKREIDWLKNMSDWLISKKRYWGLALPVFECRCGNFEVIGSLSDFDKFSPKKLNNYIFLRHGEAENNRLKIISSYPEKKKYLLTVKGAKEIEKLIPWFKKKYIDLVFSSDLLRTKETAQIIAGALNKKIIYDKRLREHDFGIYNGCTHKDWHSLFGNKTNQYSVRPPGGENLSDVKKRMMDFLKFLDAKYEGKNILIVSHANPIMAAVGAYEGYKNGEIFNLGKKFAIDGVTGSILETSGHNWPYNNEGDLDLHRPYIDEVKIKCSKCGKRVSRILDVGNPWLDAGIVPYSTMGYFENKKFWRKWFPAKLVCESFPGQFKNWFYSLIVMSTVLEKTPPMKTVFGYASVRDEKGEEMHKSKGNTIWFDEAAEKIGVEVMRWMYVKQNPADNLKFGYRTAKESERKLINLWNSFTFFKTYAVKGQRLMVESQSLLDRWILSRLNNLIEKVTKNLDKYNPASASRAIEEFFIEDLSLWYIRRSRGRFQKPKSEKEKEAAATTLYLALSDLSKLIAPFLPFLSEEIYLFLKDKKKPESVHLCDWPKSDKKFINRKLEEQMNLIRELSAKGLALRAEAGIKVRQPLASLKIQSPKSEIRKNKGLLDLIKDEVNVKEIIFGDEFELDTKITAELKEEGAIRELARQIQEMRKDGGLAAKDSIKLYFKIDDIGLKGIVERQQKNLSIEVGAKIIEFAGTVKDGLLTDRHFKMENEDIWIGIQLLNTKH